MRIAIICDSLSEQNTGIHFYSLQWIKKVLENYKRHDFFLILSKRINSIEATQIIVPIKSFVPFHYRLRYFTSIPSQLRKLNPHIVIEMSHFGPFMVPDLAKRVTMIYDITPITHSKFHTIGSVYFHKYFLKYIVKRADYIVTISNTSKNELQKHVQLENEKFVINYPTIDFKIGTKEITKKNIILALGTIEPRKDHLTLLKAYERIYNEVSDVQLDIIGKKGWKSGQFWNYYDGLSQEIQRSIRITDYLPREQVVDALHTCRIYISCSIMEGFGMPILEAMSLGIPVVLSDTPIHREVANDAAAYFPVRDNIKLSQVLFNILNDLKLQEQMSKKSLERFEYFRRKEFKVSFLE